MNSTGYHHLLLLGALLHSQAALGHPVTGEPTEPTLETVSKQDERAPPTCLAIIGSNDLHGAILPQTIRVANQEVKRGGLLALSGYIDIVKHRFPNKVVLLDGGDLLHGTLTAKVSKGEVMVQALNALEFNAAAIGNHEFDFGPLLPGDPDRLGVIKKRIGEANFPFLAANITNRVTGAPITWTNTLPATLMEIDGVQVGIVGLATPSTPLTTRPQNVATLGFLDPAPILIREAEKLRRRGAQIVILVSHMGDDCPQATDPRDLSSCDAKGELFQLLAGLPKGLVDVAVGGHTHAVVAHWIGSTATIEAAHRARKFTWVEACLDSNGQFDADTTTIHAPVDVCLTTWADGTCGPRELATETQPARYQNEIVRISPKLEAVVQPFMEKVERTSEEPIGANLPRDFERDPKRGIPLGDAVAEAMRRATQADVGLQNRGGVRADLQAGEILFGDAYRVLPFGNQVTVMRLTGAQLTAIVSHMTERHRGISPHVVGVLPAEGDGPFTLLHPNGTPLETSRIYKVATNDFLATGGQGLASLIRNIPQASVQIEPILLLDAFIDFLKTEFPPPVAKSPVQAPTSGQVVPASSPAAPTPSATTHPTARP